MFTCVSGSGFVLWEWKNLKGLVSEAICFVEELLSNKLKPSAAAKIYFRSPDDVF